MGIHQQLPQQQCDNVQVANVYTEEQDEENDRSEVLLNTSEIELDLVERQQVAVTETQPDLETQRQTRTPSRGRTRHKTGATRGGLRSRSNQPCMEDAIKKLREFQASRSRERSRSHDSSPHREPAAPTQ